MQLSNQFILLWKVIFVARTDDIDSYMDGLFPYVGAAILFRLEDCLQGGELDCEAGRQGTLCIMGISCIICKCWRLDLWPYSSCVLGC